MKEKLDGLIAAPFTALRPDGSLNLDLIERQAGELAGNGVRGAFICGTTGEGFSLTSAERMQVAERWLAVAPKQLAVIVHVAQNSVDESHMIARVKIIIRSPLIRKEERRRNKLLPFR